MALNSTWMFLLGGDNLQQLFDYDVSGNLIYQGWSQPGQATSASTWRLKKLTYNGSNQLTNIQYASGSPSFTFVWDNRTSYTYS